MFYRASTRDQAKRRKLQGYARNLDDGRVEVVIVGARAAVDSLIEWLRVGPPAARVTAVAVQEISVEELDPLAMEFGTR